MILCDVNIFVYAFREELPNHKIIKQWLEQKLLKETQFAYSDFIFSSFLRIVTHHKIFKTVVTLEKSLEFIAQIKKQTNSVKIEAGEQHWNIFLELCRETNAQGNLIPDAYIAALALEYNCDFFSTDNGFMKFKKLNWKNPL